MGNGKSKDAADKAVSAESKRARTMEKKPSPDKAIALLKEGNERFVNGKSLRPNTDFRRLIQAASESQADHAFATIITCSDSRVPVEHIFDVGIMDIFVIRVAGNICGRSECGSIEFGLAYVHTPVLVVLGHTQCGAVTAVTHVVRGNEKPEERNVPHILKYIEPAVHKAMEKHEGIEGDDIIPYAIEENIWKTVEDLFMESPVCRNLVKDGSAKVVGAVYNLATGAIDWLPESKVQEILAKVEADPWREK